LDADLRRKGGIYADNQNPDFWVGLISEDQRMRSIRFYLRSIALEAEPDLKSLMERRLTQKRRDLRR
jgi:hypothetical protein